MNEKALKTLEYHKIIELLVQHATCDPGRKLCRELLPSDRIEDIRTAQRETTDAGDRIRMKGHINFGDVHDMTGSLRRLDVQACLSMSELLWIGRLLENVQRVIAYGKHPEDETDPDSLEGYFRALDPVTSVCREISRCIETEENMYDDASPELHSIRRQMKKIADSMHAELNSILNSNRMYLMDPVVTVRDNAYCLPVKTEYRGKVPGVIHDQSATGSTTFIEPMGIIKLNNNLKELEAKEKTEIAHILERLSLMASPYKGEIADDLQLMTHLDFVFAKAGLSASMKASEPGINDRGIIRLKTARHPLLEKSTCVPIDITLGDGYDLLIVTGPNTGGKTVSLKTVGLLTLMAQAGLHIPAFQSSEVAVFREVFADIGDEQSIEQSLSTFSGHMKNIVEIIDKADADSLCLFDELGAGTDPTEGAALAIAILSFLHRMQVRTMATTHYSELKVFALQTEGVENASCEFDVNTLRPTYRILTGIPGKSNAFAISQKLGLPQFIIDEAAGNIRDNDAAFEDLIARLNADRAEIEAQRAEIEKDREEIEQLKRRHQTQDNDLDARREKILREAREEAQQILYDAKETADDTIRKINKLKNDSGLTRALEKERTRLREGIKKTENHEEPAVELDMAARLQRAWNTSAGQEPQKRSSQIRSSTIRPEINVIGKNVDEACAELDKYLDDALIAHLPKVRIIHGRGTGALKKGIRAYLKKQRFVKSYYDAAFDDGGIAVTVVEL